MNKLFILFLLTFSIFLPKQSWALFEARVTYGSLASTQDLQNICQGSCAAPTNAPAIVPTFGTGIDAIVSLPMIPFGFGLRTEDMKLSASNSNISGEVKYSRTAILLNYRLLDTIIHCGAIASFGVSHSGSMSITEGGTTVVNLSPSSLSSYSVGVELGVKPFIVLPLKIGAEAGYMSFKWGQVANTIDATQKDVDLSGIYLKAFLGLDF